MSQLMREQHVEIWRVGPDGELSLHIELDGSGFTLRHSDGAAIDMNPQQARAVIRLMRMQLGADGAPFPDPELEPGRKQEDTPAQASP